ncbi:LacI family transcriptional regulator [bacterium]|nr:LacI family transcriptional regulator [bacterium]
MSKSRVDQQAIADRLGISRSTVTRVLGHDPLHRISPDTRKLILKTAREMGYNPRRRRTGNIAFVVCGEMAPAQHELHLAICSEAFHNSYRIFLVGMPEFASYNQIKVYVNPLAADGVILTGKFSMELARSLADVMPTVLLDDRSQTLDMDMDRVRVDYVDLGYELTRMMIDVGHKRIAAIVQFPDDVAWSGPMEGFRKAYEEAGLVADISQVRHKSRVVYTKLLSDLLATKPTAIFAWTTSDHAIILSTLSAMGCRVPQDISYVGWAQSYSAALLPFPAITCLDDIYPAMARTAVHRLFDRMEDPLMPPESMTVPVGIRRGETLSKLRP